MTVPGPTAKSADQIRAIGRAGKIIGALLTELEGELHPGVSTKTVDGWVGSYIRDHRGAKPAFKGLYGFPANACISVNEEIVHGIPSSRKLEEGDLVTVDVGVRLRGWCADSAFTYAVGSASPEAVALMAVGMEALEAAISAARSGRTVGDIGAAVEEVARPAGYSIIRELVGHGIGRNIHEMPQVPNYGNPGEGAKIKGGYVLAVEPMLAAGSREIVTGKDGWTVSSRDGSLTVHYEHTVAATRKGPVVLTEGGIWRRGPHAFAGGKDGVPAKGEARPFAKRMQKELPGTLPKG